MFSFIDNLFPWFGDMVDLGGNILLVIIILAAVMWTIFLERVWYFFRVYPRYLQSAVNVWNDKSSDKSISDYNLQIYRNYILYRSKKALSQSLGLAKTLIKLCPLLGLLGTVLGMLEVFDAISITGSNSPRSTASGVSQAIFTTMAGMVIAISGLPVVGYLARKIDMENEKLKKLLILE